MQSVGGGNLNLKLIRVSGSNTYTEGKRSSLESQIPHGNRSDAGKLNSIGNLSENEEEVALLEAEIIRKYGEGSLEKLRRSKARFSNPNLDCNTVSLQNMEAVIKEKPFSEQHASSESGEKELGFPIQEVDCVNNNEGETQPEKENEQPDVEDRENGWQSPSKHKARMQSIEGKEITKNKEQEASSMGRFEALMEMSGDDSMTITTKGGGAKDNTGGSKLKQPESIRVGEGNGVELRRKPGTDLLEGSHREGRKKPGSGTKHQVAASTPTLNSKKVTR
ncbi:hypothetical protein FRX31_021395 [Thalictrum thalictroides]|uniref:Uncharacterized protein n=1 Tax=Thalictrum thalictroides TaxID=46969 RepID=A0A7J6VWN0_THATH|nr:hypothetical protein FRX31_021395 [Thalictrum thalictroides]